MNRFRKAAFASFVLGATALPGCGEEGSVATVAPAPDDAPAEGATAPRPAGGRRSPKSIGTRPSTSLAPE